MFGEITKRSQHSHKAMVASLAAHCLAVWLVLWALQPNFVRVSSVARGSHGANPSLIYLPTNEWKASTSSRAKSAAKKSHSRKKSLYFASHPVDEKADERADEKTGQAEAQAPPAGTQYGSGAFASPEGVEARPALPLVFPDPPPVSRAELFSGGEASASGASGREGDVVVEITIDAQGNVTGMKVLQSLGSAIDGKVLAALRDWRFAPATVDGRAVPSRQDVHFHFPNS